MLHILLLIHADNIIRLGSTAVVTAHITEKLMLGPIEIDRIDHPISLIVNIQTRG